MDNDFAQFLTGAALNLATALVVARFIYYPVSHDKRYVLAFVMFSTVIYFVMSMLTSIELSLGVGFGLFAIFTVLRYRTEEIPIREITYLFVMIALAVMNSALSTGDDIGKILVANGVTVATLYVLEREWGFQFQASKKITYEMIDLIRPENHDQLLADLKRRTGLSVSRVEVGRIDFLRDTAQLTIHYDEPATVPGIRSDMSADPAPAD